MKPTIPQRLVAALDELLMAIGRWQADPTAETWAQKLTAMRKYLVTMETFAP